MRELFHVHTYRCRHAGKDSDESYVEEAIRLGADAITFTDHTPFPGNPFDNRMDIEELPEYINSLQTLRKKYSRYLRIRIGLEVEYLPRYEAFYRRLHEAEGIDLLIIGQHFYQDENGDYSFGYNRKRLMQVEAAGLCDAIIRACDSGFFYAVAHPDRIFRRRFSWSPDQDELSLRLIRAALRNGLLLEKNISSVKKGFYRPQFWRHVPTHAQTIIGIDAHAARELSDALNPPAVFSDETPYSDSLTAAS